MAAASDAACLSELEGLINRSLSFSGTRPCNQSTIRTLPYSPQATTAFATAITLMMILTIVGNILVIIAVLTSRSLKGPQNLFLVSLAAADILVATLIIPFSLANELQGYWVFSSVWCEIYLALDVLFCTSSIVHLCAIALDRYLSISRPVSYGAKRTSLRIKAAIVVVWLISAVISFPPLLSLDKSDGGAEVCELNNERWYILYSTIGSFFAPCVIMILVYVRIYQIAKQHTRCPPGEKHKEVGGDANATTPKPAATLAEQSLQNGEQGGTTANQQNHITPKSPPGSNPSPSSPHIPPPQHHPPSSGGPPGSHPSPSPPHIPTPQHHPPSSGGPPGSNPSPSSPGSHPSPSPPHIPTPQQHPPSLGAAPVLMTSSSPSIPHRDDQLRSAVNCKEPQEHPGKNVPGHHDDTSSSGSEAESEFRGKGGAGENREGPREANETPVAGSAKGFKVRVLNLARRYKNTMATSSGTKLVPEGTPRIQGTPTARRKAMLNREKRFTFVLAVVMGVFVVCWFPFFFSYSLKAVCPETCSIPDPLFKFFFWIGYCNSCLNPVIYTIFNQDFRKAFKKILCRDIKGTFF